MMTHRGGSDRNPRARRQSEMLSNVTFLERPFHPATFLSVAQTALKSRQRQYEARARMLELRESEQRFRALTEGIPQLVFRARVAGERTWVSPQWLTFTGLSREASLGLGWMNAIHPEDRERTVVAWADAEKLGALSVEHRILGGADGLFHWFQTRALPLHATPGAEHAEGGGIEWLGTSTDIDDQIRARDVLTRSREELEAQVNKRTAELMAAQQTMRHAQKMEAVGQLTGGIAHDFNNILQGIGGGFELISRHLERGRLEQARHLLERCRESLDRAGGLTRRLLAFARRQRLEPKPVQPERLLQEMEDLIRRTMGPVVEVELKLRDGAAVLCDPGELEGAVLNLCINARDAMPGGGRLTINTAELILRSSDLTADEVKPGPYAVISVADTGIGMPPDVLERAFEPFFTTKPIGVGTGLGLSQIYGFARQSGGTVHLESVPKQGTTARLLLPAHETVPLVRERAVTRPHVVTEADAIVLLVDDEPIVRITTAARLRELGYDVLEAPNGPMALRILEAADHLDLLITDVGLPGGLNGRQVAEAVRERLPAVPILFITGYATTALPPGAEVIGKPFALDDLARRAQALIAGGR
jgi:PAS domain S-box-containing protein